MAEMMMNPEEAEKASGEDMEELHASAKRKFEAYLDATANGRKMAETARNYYDGDQWRADERDELSQREQDAIYVNRIFKKINFLVGSEVENRTDPTALPRTPDHDLEHEAVTDAQRFVMDQEKADEKFSECWEEELIEGVTGMLIEHEKRGVVRYEKDGKVVTKKASELPNKLPPEIADFVILDSRRIDVKLTQVPFEECWYDAHSKRRDFSDAEHLGTTRWLDAKRVKRWMKRRKDAVENWEEVIDQAVAYTGQGVTGTTHDDRPENWVKSKRKRIRVVTIYDQESGNWELGIFTAAGWLVEPRRTGYLNEDGEDVCPLELASPFVKKSTRERYGLVRHMLPLQDEINHHRAAAIHWGSLDRTIAEEGVVLDEDETAEERGKPDGWVTVQRDAIREGRIQFQDGHDKAAIELQLVQQSRQDIDSVGPDLPSLMEAAAQSGTALAQRRTVSNLEIKRPEDVHRGLKERVALQVWWRIRQFWNVAKWVRVRDGMATGKDLRWVGLNQLMTKAERVKSLIDEGADPRQALEAVGVPPEMVEQMAQQFAQQAEAQGIQMAPEQLQGIVFGELMQLPAMQEKVKANDVSKVGVDIVLDEAPDTANLQQEEFANLSRVYPTIINHPQVANSPERFDRLMEIYFKASNFRSKSEILDIWKPKKPNPAEQEFQQQMQQIQMKTQMATAAVLEAQAIKDQARAQREQAETAKVVEEAKVVQPKAAADIEAKEAQALKNTAESGAV